MSKSPIAIIGIDLGKNSFHVIGFDRRGAIVLRQKRSRHQLESSLANMVPCLIGMRPAREHTISAARSTLWVIRLG